MSAAEHTVPALPVPEVVEHFGDVAQQITETLLDPLTGSHVVERFADGTDIVMAYPLPLEYRCRFCGSPSAVDPSDQSPPPDYCDDASHGIHYGALAA